MAQLQLGSFLFEPDDLPDEITLGGEQMLTVIQYPGGHKEVQSFGAQERNPSWVGVFNYTNAIAKVRVLDAMYRSGQVFPLRIDQLSTRYCVIRKFQWIYRSPSEIPYEIELEIAPKESILLPSPHSSAPTTSPSSDSPPPQKTYTVVHGDTLWGIALRFYGDGTQYRKIATTNKIKNPDWIVVGQKLVIPS
jgi:nucleoid-associated protein YgaU